MKAIANETPLSRYLGERIEAHGPIPFAEYMRECLYHPVWGYYSRAESKRFADYYTSVDVHPIFGRMLAKQLEEMWRVMGRPAEFCAVEAAAGSGRLASQILDFAAQSLPEFYAALRYVVVESSAARRAQQIQLLAKHLEDGKCGSSAELPPEIPVGCIFSNELLDALPVHRLVVERGDLREFYITLRDAALAEELGAPSTPEIARYFSEQEAVLGEGQQAEAGLDACRWIEDAGRRLGRGFILTIDYGHWARELYDERHMRGTLLAYADHRASEDFLRAPGEQDLTAHVNFSAIDLWGRRAGLSFTGIASQMAFLLALGRDSEFSELYEPDSSELDRLRARLHLKTLIHPEGMGETFQVFVQHKDKREDEDWKLTGLAGI